MKRFDGYMPDPECQMKLHMQHRFFFDPPEFQTLFISNKGIGFQMTRLKNPILALLTLKLFKSWFWFMLFGSECSMALNPYGNFST